MKIKEGTVLVVDDDARCRELHELWLSETFDVVTAATGGDAIETVDARVDAVVLDRQMPGLSGREVAERLREMGFDLGVVMVSTLPQEDVRPDAYLRKPVTGETLTAAVASVVGTSRTAEGTRSERQGI